MFTQCPPKININLPMIKDEKNLRTTQMMTKKAQNKPTRRRHITMIVTTIMMMRIDAEEHKAEAQDADADNVSEWAEAAVQSL